MNVLMLAPEFLPCRGGVGIYVSEISRNMPTDVNIHILTPHRIQKGLPSLYDTEPIDRFLPNNIKVHYLGNARDSFFYNFQFQLHCAINVKSLINKWDIDIIHSHSAMPDLFLSPHKIKVPIITTIHTTIIWQKEAIICSQQPFLQLDSSEQFTFLLSSALIAMERRYYSKNRHYITVSEWARQKIIEEKKIHPSRIKVIHNGIDTHFFQPYNRIDAKSHFPELFSIKPPVILFLSRKIQSKGIHDFITAIPAILKKNDATFIIAGPGNSSNSLIQDPNVIHMSYIPHHLTRFLYSCADIFILPSLSENFPLSILEAMASKNAVVASKVGGIPEMITHQKDGILIPSHDPLSIEAAITHLIENESYRKKLGNNARTTVSEKFRWDQAAKVTREYYQYVIDNANNTR